MTALFLYERKDFMVITVVCDVLGESNNGTTIAA